MFNGFMAIPRNECCAAQTLRASAAENENACEEDDDVDEEEGADIDNKSFPKHMGGK